MANNRKFKVQLTIYFYNYYIKFIVKISDVKVTLTKLFKWLKSQLWWQFSLIVKYEIDFFFDNLERKLLPWIDIKMKYNHSFLSVYDYREFDPIIILRNEFFFRPIKSTYFLFRHCDKWLQILSEIIDWRDL